MKVPTIDLTGNSTESAQVQLNNILKSASPHRYQEIMDMLSGNKDYVDLITDYGYFDTKDIRAHVTAGELDNLYQGDFTSSSFNTHINPYLHIQSLYQDLTGNDNPLGEDKMGNLFEIIYGTFMNYSDYEDYLNHGDPFYFDTHDNTQLTNNVVNGVSGDFNEFTLPNWAISKVVSSGFYDDEDYRTDVGATDSEDINPYFSYDAPQNAYNEITQLLQIPMGKTIPVEFASYFSSMHVDNHFNMYLPTRSWHHFIRHKKRFSVKLSQCAMYVLTNVLKHSYLTYNAMSYNSLVHIIDKSGLFLHHLNMYMLCKKTILELYSLCWAYKDYLVLNNLRNDDMIWLRKNIKFIKKWFSHYHHYRDLCEVWELLDESVGYMQPYLNTLISKK